MDAVDRIWLTVSLMIALAAAGLLLAGCRVVVVSGEAARYTEEHQTEAGRDALRDALRDITLPLTGGGLTP
jgi:hypothetical protein